MNDLLKMMLAFLQEIDLVYYLEPINGDTFLPGLKLREGTLVIDTDRLLYPGDILHEAGHLACMPPYIRRGMSDSLEDIDMHRGGEMMAIAWSYAAAVFLDIDPAFVFHENGYKGAGNGILHHFNEGGSMGLPLLQWSGMSYDIATAIAEGSKPFPYMISWTCTKQTF